MNSHAPNPHYDKPRVLLVDDKIDMLSMLRLLVEKKCNSIVEIAQNGAEALSKLPDFDPDIVVTDIKMPGMSGLELLNKIHLEDESISVIVMTGYASVDNAVLALKNGAYDFLQKPFDKDHFVKVMHNCLERVELIRTNKRLNSKIESLSTPEGVVGESEALVETYSMIKRVARTDATVLVRGESGTGKELAVKTLHAMSERSGKEPVIVNCPALPESILESELFGYTKGAFTGAETSKKGLFLEADKSTIILDEIADIPISIQTKLLRVLQEKEIQPLGQNKTIKVDVRVVASTNQDLEAKIKEGSFREDLFYRLNVITITLPNLKKRMDDIPLLVEYFFTYYCKQYNRTDLSLSLDLVSHLYKKEWPGNIRELRNFMKRLVILQPEGEVQLSDVIEKKECKVCSDTFFGMLTEHGYNDAKQQILGDFSTYYLQEKLRESGGNVTKAAEISGVERQGFQRLMKRYGVSSSKFKP